VKRIMMGIILATALTVVAAAQAPPLAIAANPNHNDAQKTLLVNRYQAPATEWILAVRFLLPNGVSRTVIQHRWGLPATREQVPIAPGAQVTCVAVIYADGQTYGDPRVVSAMVVGRERMLHDLQAAVPLLQADAKGAGTNWSDVAADFQQRNDASHAAAVAYFRSEGGDGPAPVAADRVWGPLAQTISADIQRKEPPQAMAARYERLASYYSGWIAQLQRSLPVLQ
jgi:hypothetical protein